MNVIVANERKDELNSLKVDIIKSVDGAFTVDEIIGMFTNFFFNKMLLDITAIKDYSDYRNLKKLFEAINTNKIVILLQNNETCKSKEFISDLVTLGIYNFTLELDEVLVLFNNPKSFNDVSDLQLSKNTFDINKQIDAENGYLKEQEFTFEDFTLPGEYDGNKKIIGVVNLTEHAGATTLAVQMVKQLNFEYKAIGLEMNKQDFIFFNVPMIYSCTSREDVLKKIKEHQDVDAVIVDLNTYDYKEFCTDVIYLVEPGTIKLTKLIRRNGKAFEELSGQMIVLNRSNLDNNEVAEFEVESKCKVFANVMNFRDIVDRVLTVDELLYKLGYVKNLKTVDIPEEDFDDETESKKKKFFFFKKK